MWDFFVTTLLGAKTPDWNQILPATPPSTTSGSTVRALNKCMDVSGGGTADVAVNTPIAMILSEGEDAGAIAGLDGDPLPHFDGSEPV